MCRARPGSQPGRARFVYGCLVVLFVGVGGSAVSDVEGHTCLHRAGDRLHDRGMLIGVQVDLVGAHRALPSYSWCGPWWSPGPGRHCGDTQSGPDGHPRGGGATSVVVGGPADRVLVTGLGPTARAPAVGLVAVFVDDPGVRDLTHVFSFFADGVDRGGPRRPHQPVLVGTGTPGVHAGAVSWSRSWAGVGNARSMASSIETGICDHRRWNGAWVWVSVMWCPRASRSPRSTAPGPAGHIRPHSHARWAFSGVVGCQTSPRDTRGQLVFWQPQSGRPVQVSIRICSSHAARPSPWPRPAPSRRA